MGVVHGGGGGIANRLKFSEIFKARLEAEGGCDLEDVRVLADANDPQGVSFEIRWTNLDVAKDNLERVRSILAEPELVGNGPVSLNVYTTRLE